MAGFSYSVRIARPPEEVFPWLLDADKVPRWTGNLEAYEVEGGGPLREGSRVRQALEVSGHRVDVEMRIVRHDPPHAAESRFSTNGIDVVTTYALSPNGGGTELTQTLDAKPSGFSARMLLPVVKPRLERKLTEDLERLRALLQSE
jgi:uncharacterized protein YndB with AHSA1/START domain